MILVGICGPIGSGKTTFAEFITAVDEHHSLHLETSGVVTELANTFNAALHAQVERLEKDADLVPLSNELIGSLLPALSVMAGNEITLQQVAIEPNDLMAHPDWYEKLFFYLQQARQDPSILSAEITPDNKNNYRTLLQWIGGYFLYKLSNRLIWYEELLRRAQNAADEIQFVAMTAPRQPAEAEFIQRAGGKVIKIDRPGLVSDTTDVTERQVSEIQADITVINNGSLKDLQSVARKIHDDLLQGAPKSVYTARSLMH